SPLSAAAPAPAHARGRRSRYRAARGRAGRAAAPTASAARHGWRCQRICLASFVPSFDLEAGLAMLAAAALVAEARDQMVVDHAGGLHEGIDDGRTDEFESARAELF